MEDILRHIVNDCDSKKFIKNIGYEKLLIIILAHDIPHNLLVQLLNSSDFMNCLKIQSMTGDINDLYCKIFDECSIIEIRMFVKGLSENSINSHLNLFLNFLNNVWDDDQNCKSLEIITACKHILLKRQNIKLALKSLALIGIYPKNIEELLEEGYKDIKFIDSLYYNQRNRKMRMFITSSFNKTLSNNQQSGCDEHQFINNIILIKLIIKTMTLLDIKHWKWCRNLHTSPLICYQYNIINGREPLSKYISDIHYMDIWDMIGYQHRKIFDKILSVLQKNIPINKGITIYKLLLKLLQIFTTKNMTKLILYFV